MLSAYTRKAFVSADDATRDRLAAELSILLSERILNGSNFHADAFAIVSELREMGHDLWSFDESDDMQAWCPDWVRGTGPGIAVTLRPEQVRVVWSPK